MKWISGWSAAATFEDKFSNVMSSHAGNGIVRYKQHFRTRPNQ
jgi:hypothetical protein